MPRIVPCFWFDDQAEQAAAHYLTIFPNSTIDKVTRYGPDTPGPEGAVMTVAFTLDGEPFIGLNGGPIFSFSEAISFEIECADQDEIDHYWSRLSDGGQESQCGWLKDRFGISWQVVPPILHQLIADPDPERAQRATQAMLGMRKIEIAELLRAADEITV